MADQPRGRGKARGRSRLVQPAPPPAVASSSGSIRPPVGRSSSQSQPASSGDIVGRVAQMSISSGSKGNNGNGKGNGNGNGNGNGSGKPVGRGSVRPNRSDAEILRTRPDTAGCKQGETGNKIKLTSNYFNLSASAKTGLCKHHVDFDPPEDRTFMRKVLMRQHQSIFVGYLFDGSTLFTNRNACPDNKPMELVSANREDQRFKITVKFVGTVEPGDYQYLQVYNIILRDCQAYLKLQPIRRNYYDPQAKVEISEHKLELWPGYATSVCQMEHSVMLQAEINYKVLRRDTAYDLFTECCNDRRQDLKTTYSSIMIGSVIITLYNNKTYRIDEVDYEVRPTSTFSQTKKGESKNISYVDYFKERYNVRVRDINQPMLISRSSARDRRAGLPELIYLVPELCVMTGLTDNMRNNFRLMKAVADHTCVGPADRVRRLKNFSNRLNGIVEVRQKLKDWGLQLAQNLVEIPGRILPTEMIRVGDERKYDAGKDANWDRNLRSSKMLQGVDLKNWVILYPMRSENEAKNFCSSLEKVAQGMCYTIAKPYLYSLQGDRVADYVSNLDRAINERNPQLVMCVVPNNNSGRYSAIKKKCIIDKPVPSQVVLYKTITAKGVMSIATKVAIQMNCKVGGAPWGVDIPVKGLMAVGFDVCHDPNDKRRSYGAMVATIDKACAHWYSTITRHSAGEELSTNFALNIQKSVQKYKEYNEGQLPTVILIFRDGVGEGQLQYVYEQEVNQVKQGIQDEYKKANKELKLCFIVVTKRINTRIFYNDFNPPPGTVVDDVITNPFRYDFYLVSQSVRQGTVSPTHYNVIEDTTNIKPDHIQRLTYKFTHLYYNWSGTVRVPAPCQYAHKLAFLTAQSIGVTHSNMDRLLYYL